MNNSKFELRLLSSMAKVLPNCAPPARHEKEWLSALCGERVSFQVAYRNNGIQGSWARVKLTSSAIPLTMRLVRYVPSAVVANQWQTDDGYISAEAGMFPDLLEPLEADRLPIIAGSNWRCIWIDAEIAPGTAAGHYSISVCVETREGEVIGSVETSLEVIQAELPPLSIPNTKWFHTDCLANYYGVEVFSEPYWEIVENFAKCAVQHGVNMMLTPIHTPPLDTEVGGERLTVQLIDVTVTNGKYTFGFDKLERWVKMCRRLGVEYYEMAHLFTQWGAKHAPKIMGTKDGTYTRLFGWDTDSTGPEYSRYLQQMLPALTTKLSELGIADKTYFHISDEPITEQLSQYSAAYAIAKPLLEGFKIFDALSDYEFYQNGIVTIPVSALDHIEPFLEGEVPELWGYYCCAQSYKVPNYFLMQPSFRNRILGALLYKFNIAGFLQWGYNYYNSIHSVHPINPYIVTDADGAYPSGDPFIVYPGPNGQPLASMRLMVNQEGFNDLCALRLLEQLTDRDFVLALIDGDLAQPITFTCFPQNEEYLLSLRNRVNREIARRIK